jgi:hypothetical protein
MRAQTLPPTGTRVERNTPSEANELIRARTDARLARLEGGQAVEFRARLSELDREWDIERVLQANASTLVVLGTLLGAKVDRRFLLLPAAVLTFFAQHALQGWCPPLPVLRRHGVRATREIERERYAIKALRGDFDSIPAREATDVQQRVRAVIAAVDA